MLRGFREAIKRSPIGPKLHGLYLQTFYSEGEIIEISGGLLAGHKWVRFMRSHNQEYVQGTYEQSLQDEIARLLKPGMTFYDVGANAGFFSLLASHLVGPAGHVVSFEPHPVTASNLSAQMRVNGASNVEIIEAAVCDRVGSAKFSDGDVSVMTSLAAAATAARTIEVKTIDLDTVIKGHRPPDVLKLDVEGAEMDALAGARQMLSLIRPVMLVELHTAQIARDFERLMQSINYTSKSLNQEEGAEWERFVVATPN